MMLNYQEEQEMKGNEDKSPFRMATVISKTTYTAVVRFDGDDTNSTKEFKRLYGMSVYAGDRVLCARYGGTYIVLGAIK